MVFTFQILFDVILIETKLIIRTHDRLSIGSVSRLQEFFYPFSFLFLEVNQTEIKYNRILGLQTSVLLFSFLIYKREIWS